MMDVEPTGVTGGQVGIHTGRVRLITITLAVMIGAAAAGPVPGSAAAALAIPHAPAPRACTSCTYVVTPTGTGAQNLQYVLSHLAQPSDVVELADGVYRVGNLDVKVPGVTIRAQHLPGSTGPRVWLDGSVAYRYWNHPSATIWSHGYQRDFCETSLRNIACTQLSVSYHGDQLFRNGVPVTQTIHPYDLLDPAHPVFYISTSSHEVLTNVDPGTTAEMTDQQTALVFERSAVGASLQGIGVRRYAGNDHDPTNLASHQDAAIYVADASNVAFRNDSFSFNSVRAIKTHGDVPASQTPVAGAGVVIDTSVFDHNGELGLDSVDSDGIVISHSLFYRNNYADFAIEPGAAKLLSVHDATVTDNRFVENNGIGLWFDRSSYGGYVAHNAFTANVWHGIMYEISARVTITANTFDGNRHVGMLLYEASEVSFSHNLLIGNLEGIKVQEGHRTRANFPSGRDSDPDRIMPDDITFDVSAVDIHSNGFYYYPAHPSTEVCDPNPTAMPTPSEPDPYSGCQYMIAAQDSYAGREPSSLGIAPVHDNFHRRNWPSNPAAAPVPVFTALWKAPASLYGALGCVGSQSGTVIYRWTMLHDFQCAGQEAGGSSPY